MCPFFLGESQSRIYPNMCAKFGCGPTVVSKGGGGYRQTDKGTLQLYIVDKQSFNVFCYADDLMLASLTVTGLQTMINVANRYTTEHGLPFNPKKVDCVIFGRSTLQPHPKWELNGTKLTETDSVTYLGVTLSCVKPNIHVDNRRISACRRAYYAMQGAGLCNNVTDADAITYLWNHAAIRPVTCGINCIHVSKTCLSRMETLQAKLLKTGIGVHKWSRKFSCLESTEH